MEANVVSPRDASNSTLCFDGYFENDSIVDVNEMKISWPLV